MRTKKQMYKTAKWHGQFVALKKYDPQTDVYVIETIDKHEFFIHYDAMTNYCL